MRKLIKVLVGIVVVVVILLLMLFMRNGILFQQMAKSERNNYATQQEELNNTHELEEGVEEVATDAYNIYYTDDNVQNKPVIIDINGGGLISGNKDFNRYFNSKLAKQGYVVFAVSYDLIPEVMVYDQLQQIADGMNTVSTLISTYNGDIDNVHIVADSAGAYLALYTVAIQNDPDMATAFNVTPSTLDVKSLGLISGMFYTTRSDNIGIFLKNQIYGNFPSKEIKQYMDPEYIANNVNLPAIYMSTSTGDYLTDYTKDFYSVLSKTDTVCEMRNFENDNLEHAFPVFHPEYPETDELIADIVAFFSNN